MTDKMKDLNELSQHPALLKGLAAQAATAGTKAPASAENAPKAAIEPPVARAHSNPTAALPHYRFDYVNYKGEISTRDVIPRFIYFGATEFHPEPQWLMKAYDPFKAAERDFAMADMYPPSFVGALTDAIEATNVFHETLMEDIKEAATPVHANTDTMRQIMGRRWNALSKKYLGIGR